MGKGAGRGEPGAVKETGYGETGKMWAYMKMSEEGKRRAGGSENLRDFQEIWTMELS